MAIVIKKTNSSDKIFQELVKLLDEDLKVRDGDEHAFYAQFNKTHTLNYVLVAYDNNEPCGCGALRAYSNDTMEIKRMFVSPGKRRQGIASIILQALKAWSRE